jgi:formylglycine-generating enzyme required for sulfatase activity
LSKPRIFLSYAREDGESVKRLYQALTDAGFEPWMDVEKLFPGEQWNLAIERAIRQADFFVACISTRSVNKRGVIQKEIREALDIWQEKLDSDIYLIPARLEDCQTPPALARIQWVDLFRDDGFARLHRALEEGTRRRGNNPPPKSPSPIYAPTPQAVVLKPSSLPNWLVPVGAGGAGIVLLCVLIALGVNGILNNPTPTPTQVVARAPTQAPSNTSVPTNTSTRLPTQTPFVVTATPLPTPTFTAPSPITSTTLTLRDGNTRSFPPDNAPMMFVSAGDFKMGSDDADKDAYSDERPQHTVYLDAFWMDKFEVTNALYKKCVSDGVCTAPSNESSSKRNPYYDNSKYADYPVIYITWDQANTYCTKWAGKRLPTEAEWEKAARGTDGRIYPWVGAFDGARLNSWDSNPRPGDTTAIGSYPTGASPYGIMDLAGNVWEWVADWYNGKYYASSPRNNPRNDTPGPYRVLRGGAWNDSSGNPRAANRNDNAPTNFNDNVGFRCARSP